MDVLVVDKEIEGQGEEGNGGKGALLRLPKGKLVQRWLLLVLVSTVPYVQYWDWQ